MKTLKQGTIKRLHVNRHVMGANRKTGADDYALTIQTSKGPIRTNAAWVEGKCRFVQAGGIHNIKPLKCGARAWIETRAEVNYNE